MSPDAPMFTDQVPPGPRTISADQMMVELNSVVYLLSALIFAVHERGLVTADQVIGFMRLSEDCARSSAAGSSMAMATLLRNLKDLGVVAPDTAAPRPRLGVIAGGKEDQRGEAETPGDVT